ADDDVIKIICKGTKDKLTLLIRVLAGDRRAVELKLDQDPAREITPSDVQFADDATDLLCQRGGCWQEEETEKGKQAFSGVALHGATAKGKRGLFRHRTSPDSRMVRSSASARIEGYGRSMPRPPFRNCRPSCHCGRRHRPWQSQSSRD